MERTACCVYNILPDNCLWSWTISGPNLTISGPNLTMSGPKLTISGPNLTLCCHWLLDWAVPHRQPHAAFLPSSGFNTASSCPFSFIIHSVDVLWQNCWMVFFYGCSRHNFMSFEIVHGRKNCYAIQNCWLNDYTGPFTWGNLPPEFMTAFYTVTALSRGGQSL